MKWTTLALFALCLSVAYVAVTGIDVEDLQEAVRKLAERVEVLETTVKKLSSGKGASAESAVDDKHVVVLNGDNFQSEINKNEITLVEFYAPWCGHCKALAPEYARAAEELQGGKNGALAKVDCTGDDNKALCEKHGVSGYPTIKLFRKNGDVSEYNGDRSADGIVKFMKKQSQPAITDLSTVEGVREFAADDPVKIVAFLAEGASDTTFTAVANKLRNDFAFAIVRNQPAVAQEFGVTTGSSIVMIRDFSNENAQTQVDLSEADLVTWIKAESFPTVGTIGPDNYMRYVERGLNFVWIFYDPESTEQETLLNTDINDVATQYRGKLSFVKLDGKMWGEHAKTFGLSGKLPGIALEDREAKRQYVFDQDTAVTKGSFANFIKGYLDGSLRPYMKSEPEPETNDGPVKIVVGVNFDKIVLDDSKDVLVEFYAPWCGHCKALEPKYDDLGRQYAKDSSIVVAKVDATANDTPIQVSGFPSIKFFPAGDKKNPIDYNGERTASAMAEFIEQHRSTRAAKDDL